MNPRDALQGADNALLKEPKNPAWLLRRAQCLLALGRLAQARDAVAAAQRHAPADPQFWDAIGTLHSHAGDHAAALAAYDRALALAPDHPQILYNRAAVRRYVGQLIAAEADYDRVIALRPADYEAYKNRSDLRTQTAARNHVRELERLLAGKLPAAGEVQLRHALAKEYEDLGAYESSFSHLERGARLQRRSLRYDVANDVATVEWIIAAFPAPAVPAPLDHAADAPIFIVGLPRSGTSLVDRILGSHSTLVSAGELSDFAISLVDAVRRQSGRTELSRRELVALSASVDFAALGRDYLDRTRAAAAGRRFTDKMPLNYLYCGLILRALPNARIVHVSRHPMAVGHAMYKTLFKDGYPFSYDLLEIGRYYAAYRRLMDHWQTILPGAILSVDYEALIANQPGQTRRLLDFCGLPWEDACLEFHRNPAPITTASAAQVRRPLYDSSVSLWRRYEQHLGVLRSELAAHGISVPE